MIDFKPKNKECPICDEQWQVTSFGTKTWYDCVKCNMKAEKLDKEVKDDREEDFGYFTLPPSYSFTD